MQGNGVCRQPFDNFRLALLPPVPPLWTPLLLLPWPLSVDYRGQKPPSGPLRSRWTPSCSWPRPPPTAPGPAGPGSPVGGGGSPLLTPGERAHLAREHVPKVCPYPPHRPRLVLTSCYIVFTRYKSFATKISFLAWKKTLNCRGNKGVFS